MKPTAERQVLSLRIQESRLRKVVPRAAADAALDPQIEATGDHRPAARASLHAPTPKWSEAQRELYSDGATRASPRTLGQHVGLRLVPRARSASTIRIRRAGLAERSDPGHIPPRSLSRQRRIPRSSRTTSPEAPADARKSPQASGRKALLSPEVPACPRTARKRHDRPVTPEVAGLSPVAPVEISLQRCALCCRVRERSWRARAANDRNGDDRGAGDRRRGRPTSCVLARSHARLDRFAS